jgi:hypothetical protein
MKLPVGINKLGVVVLGVVCLFLVANLVTQYRGMQPGHARQNPESATAFHARAGKGASHAAEDLAQYDPSVHFDTLKALDSRPLPDEDRNPFEFVGGEAPPPPKQDAPKTVLPAPPPPPPPLKAVGYNELPGGQKEAMVTLNDDMNMVHEGDMIGTKYKVLSISSAKVVVEDANTHEKLELPFPQ